MAVLQEIQSFYHIARTKLRVSEWSVDDNAVRTQWSRSAGRERETEASVFEQAHAMQPHIGHP